MEELARGTEVWLGLSKENTSASWEWVNGNEPNEIKWAIGQPNQFVNNDNCCILSNRQANDVPVSLNIFIIGIVSKPLS